MRERIAGALIIKERARVKMKLWPVEAESAS